MLKRLRDKQRAFRPQQHISYEDWKQISDRASKAKTFFKEENQVYLTMKASLEDALKIVTENRIHEVREEYTISDTLKKVFITPKKIQEDELVGQIKFIKEMFAEIQSWIDYKTDMEHKEADGIISISRSPDQNG